VVFILKIKAKYQQKRTATRKVNFNRRIYTNLRKPQQKPCTNNRWRQLVYLSPGAQSSLRINQQSSHRL